MHEQSGALRGAIDDSPRSGAAGAVHIFAERGSRPMPRIARSLMLLAGLTITGCQCCACTEHIADTVDLVSSREFQGEIFYHPGLDLTRIGRRDWCQCGINHWLCPCRCDRYACQDANCP